MEKIQRPRGRARNVVYEMTWGHGQLEHLESTRLKPPPTDGQGRAMPIAANQGQQERIIPKVAS